MQFGKKKVMYLERNGIFRSSKNRKKTANPSVKGTEMKGVQEESYFDIPVSNFNWPLLHTFFALEIIY